MKKKLLAVGIVAAIAGIVAAMRKRKKYINAKGSKAISEPEASGAKKEEAHEAI